MITNWEMYGKLLKAYNITNTESFRINIKNQYQRHFSLTYMLKKRHQNAPFSVSSAFWCVLTNTHRWRRIICFFFLLPSRLPLNKKKKNNKKEKNNSNNNKRGVWVFLREKKLRIYFCLAPSCLPFKHPTL
jgi:hypothetical protein